MQHRILKNVVGSGQTSLPSTSLHDIVGKQYALGHGKLKVMSASLGIRHLILASHISIYRLILLENIGILVYL